MIYNVVLVCGVQQSDSAIHMYIHILFPIPFLYLFLIDAVPFSAYSWEHHRESCQLFLYSKPRTKNEVCDESPGRENARKGSEDWKEGKRPWKD